MIEAFKDNMEITIAVLGLFALISAYIIFTLFFSNRSQTAKRLDAIAKRREILKKTYMEQEEVKVKKTLQNSFGKLIISKFKVLQMKGADEVKKRMLQAGWRSKESIALYVFLQMVLPVALLLFTTLLFFGLGAGPDLKLLQKISIILFSSIISGLLPNFYLKRHTKARLARLQNMLPDGLDLMVICAEAGLSLDATLERVSRELMSTVPDIAEELGITGAELAFMPERHMAMRNMTERVPLPSIVALVNTLIQTERYGTPLAQGLRVLSAELREERMMKAEEKAAKLPAILTVPMILFILPPLFIVLVGPAAIKAIAVANGG